MTIPLLSCRFHSLRLQDAVFFVSAEYRRAVCVPIDAMKILSSRSILAAVLVSFTSSCTTAYDAYGRPQQVVSPGGALLGAAVVGLVAYGLASGGNNNNNRQCQSNRSGYNNYGYNNYGYNGYGYNGYGYNGHHHRNNW